VSSATNADPAPIKSTASVELTGAAEEPQPAKPEALELWVGGKDGLGLKMAPRDDTLMGEQVLEAPLLHREIVEGGRGSGAPERKSECDMVSQRAQGRASAYGVIARGPTKHERERALSMREDTTG
jgi:hypothetical protein